MRVIEITGEPILHGGQEKFLENLLRNIDYSDLSIDVLTPYQCENDLFRNLVQTNGGDVYELKMAFRPGRSRRFLLRPIMQFLKDRDYDVVHVHSGSVSVLAYVSLAAKRAGVKKIIVHSHSTGYPSIKHNLIRFLFGFILSGCATDYLACSREAGLTKFPKKIVDNQLVVVNNGIDIDSFKFSPEKRRILREKYNIGDDSFVLGHVGRFSKEKNHSFLIELFSEIHRMVSNSVLLLVGDGELIQNIREQVRDLNLENVVIFTGNVDNVQEYYQAMDVFLLPSLYEGLSYVTIEAQATGIPCIISTGVPGVVVMGENVKRISLDNSAKWIDEVLTCQGAKHVENAQTLREAGYDVADTANHIREIYLDMNKREEC
jgi:glycosyltransferase involved in cell wall biosynthesis